MRADDKPTTEMRLLPQSRQQKRCKITPPQLTPGSLACSLRAQLPTVPLPALRDILVDAGGLYDRGVPVRLAYDKTENGTVAQVMTPDILVLMAHQVCRPYSLKEKKGGEDRRSGCPPTAPVRGHVPRLARGMAPSSAEWHRLCPNSRRKRHDPVGRGLRPGLRHVARARAGSQRSRSGPTHAGGGGDGPAVPPQDLPHFLLRRCRNSRDRRSFGSRHRPAAGQG